MALISKLEEKSMERPSLHKPIRATYSVFETDGRKLFQLDSYGSEDRDMPGKKSQSFQFDEAAAKKLLSILKQEFGE